MEIKGYEEITSKDVNELHHNDYIFVRDEDDNDFYFKKVQKFPIVFKSDSFNNRRFEVLENGAIIFIDEDLNSYSFDESFGDELELLEQAIEKSKELRKWQ